MKESVGSLNKQITSLEKSQRASESKLLSALSELTNSLINSKHEQSKALQLLSSAQYKLNDQIVETQKKERKPLMLVIPGLIKSIVT